MVQYCRYIWTVYFSNEQDPRESMAEAKPAQFKQRHNCDVFITLASFI